MQTELWVLPALWKRHSVHGQGKGTTFLQGCFRWGHCLLYAPNSTSSPTGPALHPRTQIKRGPPPPYLVHVGKQQQGQLLQHVRRVYREKKFQPVHGDVSVNLGEADTEKLGSERDAEHKPQQRVSLVCGTPCHRTCGTPCHRTWGWHLAWMS